MNRLKILASFSVALLILWSMPLLKAQSSETYSVQIDKLERDIKKGGFLFTPKKVDYTLAWSLYKSEGGQLVLVNALDASNDDHFEVSCVVEEKGDVGAPVVYDAGKNMQYVLADKDAGVKYGFKVIATVGGRRIESGVAWSRVGREGDGENGAGMQWTHYFPLNGRIPFAIIKRTSFFDNSTLAGKFAFHLIWNFFLSGMFILFRSCIPTLSLWSVFPLKKRTKCLRFLPMVTHKKYIMGKVHKKTRMGWDDIYLRFENERFHQIINDWKTIINKTNTAIKEELDKKLIVRKNNEQKELTINDIEGANIKNWNQQGHEDIKKLLLDLDQPVEPPKNGEEPSEKSELPAEDDPVGFIPRPKRFSDYPVAKIIKAGLENHELNGYHWIEVSKEVDRAIENRASSEIEKLRRKSLLDWLWNLGTLAPLIGLFGTATGISHAFVKLTQLDNSITQNELVKQLAGGIYEALWTTIEGLVVGVFLMLLYYFYNNKLNWIYSKWEELYVNVTEKL